MNRRPWLALAALAIVLSVSGCGEELPPWRQYKHTPQPGEIYVQVFLKEGAATATVDALQRNIAAMDNVASVTYVSSAQAKARRLELVSQTPELVEAFQNAVMPASLELSLDDPGQAEKVVDQILDDPLLDQVITNPDEPLEGDIEFSDRFPVAY